MNVIAPNEVRIDGLPYPILGTVRDQIVNPFPARIQYGDSTRDDDVIKSYWAATDWTGGLGIQHGDPTGYPDRYDFALAETRFPRQLGLLPRVHAHGPLGSVTHIIPFSGATLFFAGVGVYIRQEQTGEFIQVGSLPAPPTSVTLFRGEVWVALGTSYPIHRYDGLDWSPVASPDATNGILGGIHLIPYEDKLFTFAGDGVMYWTVDGEVWEAGGEFPQGAGWVSQLIIYFDQAEMPSIHAIGRDGVYGYDVETGIWGQTPLVYPEHPYVGKACVWRSDLYVPVGLDVYRYNGSVIQSVGPARDEGLPEEYQGYIAKLIPTHPYIYAVVNSIAEIEGTIEEPISTATPWQPVIFPGTNSRGLLLCTTGTSWHALWEGQTGIDTAALSTGEGRYRLWWSSGGQLYSTDIPKSMHNALRNPASEFQETGYLITPWFDAQWAELDKLATDIKVTAYHITDTEGYEIRAQWDSPKAPWQFIGRSQPGQDRQVFPIDYEEGGRAFRRVRLRIDLFRGDDPKRTPIIDNITLTFLRIPPPVWAYQLTIDLSKPYKGRSVREMQRDLLRLLERRKAFFFAFHDGEHDEPAVRRVIFSRNAGVRLTGLDRRGQVHLSLIELEPRP